MPTLPKMYDIELLVKAESQEAAFKIITNVAPNWGVGGKMIEHGPGYFIARDSFSELDITDEFFNKIRQSDCVALLSDGSAADRRTSILDDSSAVELALRKLLLHINGSVEVYYELFKKQEYTKAYGVKGEVIMEGEADPAASHLQFGDMIKLLGSDLNAYKQSLKDMKDWAALLEGIATLDELRIEIAERLKVRQVWEVISDNLFVAPVPWSELAPMLEDLKSLRNRAGHFQALAPKDVIAATNLRQEILQKIGEGNQKPANEVDYDKLSGLDTWISKHLFSDWVSALEQSQAAAFSQQMSALTAGPDFSNLIPDYKEELIDALIPRNDWSHLFVDPSLAMRRALFGDDDKQSKDKENESKH